MIDYLILIINHVNICGFSLVMINKSKLDNLGTCIELQKDTQLFTEGQKPKGVYKIVNGKIKIFTIGHEGKEHIINISTENDIIGFRSMLSEEAYKVSASSLEKCEIRFVSRDTFMKLMESDTVFRNNMIKMLSKELGDRALFVTTMSQKTARARLAVSLIQLFNLYNGPINLSREDLANFVGTATENLIRLLKDLKMQGVIDTKGRLIHIKKLNELKIISND